MAGSCGWPKAWFQQMLTPDGASPARHLALWFALVRDAGWRHCWLLARADSKCVTGTLAAPVSMG